jgi:NTE family protein
MLSQAVGKPFEMAQIVSIAERRIERGDRLAVMLTGGGARAAYQVGLLKGIARHFPDLEFQIITGASAGAINATILAAHEGSLPERVQRLTEMWRELECHHIFHWNPAAFLPFASALRSLFPRRMKRVGGMLDSSPLQDLLRRIFNTPGKNQPIEGISRNLAEGRLESVAITALDYSTGQSVRWIQGAQLEGYEGPNHRSSMETLTVEHVMASAALPFVFPAVNLGDRWYGDGGIRLAAPLSPAVHLGAGRILAMSTGYQRTPEEAATPVVCGYPPAAQILGQMVNAVFLDAIDEDVARMERMNEMLSKIDMKDRNGFKSIDLLVLRPSIDLGKLAGDYERYLPRSLKLVTRAMGSKETSVPDFLSLLMFEPHYTETLIATGEADVTARLDELRPFLEGSGRKSKVA